MEPNYIYPSNNLAVDQSQNLQPVNQYQSFQPTEQTLPLVQQQQNMGLAIDTQSYFERYQGLLAGFKQNIDCMVLPSKRNGDTFILTKAGAEKICRFFGLNYHLSLQPSTQLDFMQGIFYYAYECKLSHSGVLVGNGFGNCNNKESKYAKSYAPDIMNTIDKMAQKRAFTSAVLLTTGGSRFFGQKLHNLM